MLASHLPLPSGMEEWAPLGFRGAVEEFKRRLIETALRQAGGNRTHAARGLGLQRTYLLRLIRDLAVSAPPPPNGSRPPAPAKSVDTSRTPGVK